MKPNLQPFQNQSFINIESFRKDGTGVKTPVWFAQDGDLLCVRTGGDSWKVKRMRKNPQINVVPCKAQGDPLGAWVPARAKIVTDPARVKEINALLKRKYGLQKAMFDLLGKARKFESATVEIELEG
jgi:hypothetical protein